MSAKHGVDFLRTISEYIAKKGFDNVTQMLKITGGGNGRCIAEFIVKPEHLNRMGTLHGGLSATLLDNVTTYAVMSKGTHPGVSVNLNVNYISAAKVGDEIVVDANIVRVGRKLAYIECELRRKSDDGIIAKGGQTKYVNFDVGSFKTDE